MGATPLYEAILYMEHVFAIAKNAILARMVARDLNLYTIKFQPYPGGHVPILTPVLNNVSTCNLPSISQNLLFYEELYFQVV